MNEQNKSRDVSTLIALVNAMIEYWKEIARRNFVKAHPQVDPSEFERNWPKALANFLSRRNRARCEISGPTIRKP